MGMYDRNEVLRASENPYLLLTPGPLSTTRTVRETMLKDWCTWDHDYHELVQFIRHQLIHMASNKSDLLTCVLMQGSGTFCVEAVIGSAIPQDGKLLVLANGVYGNRIASIARVLNIPLAVLDFDETGVPDVEAVTRALEGDPDITHVAMVHCETTTGMLNPVREIGLVVKRYNKTFLVDAMSSFGGIEMDLVDWGIDFLISSANKCIQGVPGFGFVIARRNAIETCRGQARSLSLDLYDQWHTMETQGGKWRFTSPTHTVRAFVQALEELEDEGGVPARASRYRHNQATLVAGMKELGFACLLPDTLQSPIITSFLDPLDDGYRFDEWYARLKREGFVIYPGKVTSAPTFRIGNIGDVHNTDIERLMKALRATRFW